MRAGRVGETLRLWAPAKVNLFLEVKGKRTDGYHELHMFMAPISLGDELRISALDRPGRVEMVVEGAQELGPVEKNLCHIAARYYFACSGVTGGANIELTKRVPSGAGLGGGSSDAAATIMGLERLWGVALTQPQRRQAAFSVGADVPFFFARSAAWVSGIGEVVAPIREVAPLWLVLIHPGVFLSTAEVFSRFNRGLTRVRQPPTITQFNFQGFVDGMRNDLEPSAVSIEPVISTALRVLRDAGLEGRLMSGSGSAVFGLAPDRARAEAAAEAVRQHPEAGAWRVEVVHTLPPGSFPFLAT